MKTKAKHNKLVLELINDADYKISNDGTILKRIRKWDDSTKKELFKKVGFKNNKDGYTYVRYKRKKLAVHRIIFAKFIGNLKHPLVINHKDGNPANNHFENLEQVTESQNLIHAYRVLGNRPAVAKLSWNQIDEIKAAWGSKKYTMTKLAEQYGVNKSNISRLLSGDTYQFRAVGIDEQQD